MRTIAMLLVGFLSAIALANTMPEIQATPSQVFVPVVQTEYITAPAKAVDHSERDTLRTENARLNSELQVWRDYCTRNGVESNTGKTTATEAIYSHSLSPYAASRKDAAGSGERVLFGRLRGRRCGPRGCR